MCLICSYWLGLTQLANSEDSLFDLFSDRYKNRIASLGALGQNTSYSKFNEKFDDHIREEWSYFLDGTYGLCTKPGLPEDIAPTSLSVALGIDLLMKLDGIIISRFQTL